MEGTNLSDVSGKGGDKGVGEAHSGCGTLDRISVLEAEYSDAPNKVIVDPVRVKIPIAPWLCLARISVSSYSPRSSHRTGLTCLKHFG